MQAALLLESMETGVPFAGVSESEGTTGMPITHADVTLVEEGMIGKVVGGKVLVDISGVPFENGQYLIST